MIDSLELPAEFQDAVAVMRKRWHRVEVDFIGGSVADPTIYLKVWRDEDADHPSDRVLFMHDGDAMHAALRPVGNGEMPRMIRDPAFKVSDLLPETDDSPGGSPPSKPRRRRFGAVHEHTPKSSELWATKAELQRQLDQAERDFVKCQSTANLMLTQTARYALNAVDQRIVELEAS